MSQRVDSFETLDTQNWNLDLSDIDYEAAYLQTIKNPAVYQEDLVKSVSTIVKACAITLAVSRASLWVMSDDASGMDCLVLYDVEGDTFESGAFLSETMFPDYFDALHNGRVLAASNTFTDPRTSELTETYLEVLDVRSLLDSTIRNPQNGQLKGVFCLEMVGSSRDWTFDERTYAASISDLLSQRLLTTEWTRTTQNFKALYDRSSEGVFVFDDGVFDDVNPAGCRVFGATCQDEMIGLSILDLSPEFQPNGQTSVDLGAEHMEASKVATPYTFEWVHTRIDGTDFESEVTLNSVHFAGQDTMFAYIRDVTEQKESERRERAALAQLEHRATHDSLTGLANRSQLHTRVHELVASSQEVALVLLDLNRFKEINDTLGHATGDKVLVAIAERLNPRVENAGGSLFRLGGDEFVAIFASQSCAVPFEQLPSLICSGISSSIEVEDVSFEMSASMGIALFPRDGNTSDELLRCADVAMYHAKNQDGASLWYSLENDANSKGRLSMAAELRHAIQEDALLLHYQPRINVSTGTVTGCEALVRWDKPGVGLVPPKEFIPLAEMTELIHPLTNWVVNSALDQSVRLTSLGFEVPIAVNLSARNLPDNQLFDMIETRLAKEGISPRALEIEITESALINNPQRSLQNLRRLEELGVSIAIDDFGTGYSSLSLLKQLPLDTLKIDRSFVNDMLTSAPDRVIVNSTISLAHNFSAKVVAEGVENAETLDALRALNCEEAQGYFIARPMPADLLEEWIYQRSDRQQAA